MPVAVDIRCEEFILRRGRRKKLLLFRTLAVRHSGAEQPRVRSGKQFEFVVGSRPCSEGFSPGSPVFLPP